MSTESHHLGPFSLSARRHCVAVRKGPTFSSALHKAKSSLFGSIYCLLPGQFCYFYNFSPFFYAYLTYILCLALLHPQQPLFQSTNQLVMRDTCTRSPRSTIYASHFLHFFVLHYLYVVACDPCGSSLILHYYLCSTTWQ